MPENTPPNERDLKWVKFKDGTVGREPRDPNELAKQGYRRNKTKTFRYRKGMFGTIVEIYNNKEAKP